MASLTQWNLAEQILGDGEGWACMLQSIGSQRVGIMTERLNNNKSYSVKKEVSLKFSKLLQFLLTESKHPNLYDVSVKLSLHYFFLLYILTPPLTSTPLKLLHRKFAPCPLQTSHALNALL